MWPEPFTTHGVLVYGTIPDYVGAGPVVPLPPVPPEDLPGFVLASIAFPVLGMAGEAWAGFVLDDVAYPVLW